MCQLLSFDNFNADQGHMLQANSLAVQTILTDHICQIILDIRKYGKVTKITAPYKLFVQPHLSKSILHLTY